MDLSATAATALGSPWSSSWVTREVKTTGHPTSSMRWRHDIESSSFDNAGIGQTTMPPGTLSISGMADQTAAFIAALGINHPDVLGWSMGGMIAEALAFYIRPTCSDSC